MNETDRVHILLSRIIDHFQSVLGDNLAGVYLHGSPVMGCFNWRTSDIDLIVVVREKMTGSTKKALIAFILELTPDAPPKGLEFSIVLLHDTLHFTYPTPYELHYSPAWFDRYRAGKVDYDTQQTDPDLAAHFTLVRTYGKCLYGQPIAEVFGDVPERHYWASIIYDAEDILNNIAGDPVYGVLNLCRVIAYKYERLILSKVDGARWGLENLDPRYHGLIEQALSVYQAVDPVNVGWDNQQLEDFAGYARRLLED